MAPHPDGSRHSIHHRLEQRESSGEGNSWSRSPSRYSPDHHQCSYSGNSYNYSSDLNLHTKNCSRGRDQTHLERRKKSISPIFCNRTRERSAKLLAGTALPRTTPEGGIHSPGATGMYWIPWDVLWTLLVQSVEGMVQHPGASEEDDAKLGRWTSPSAGSSSSHWVHRRAVPLPLPCILTKEENLQLCRETVHQA